MKLAIGYHIQDGPWGGGNQFARSLAQAAEARGDEVVFMLKDPDIDLILITDPRGRSPQVSFDAGAVLRYLITRNPKALVAHRINECDERKGTRHMNRLLKRANYVADHTVFIASWLRDLDLWDRTKPSSVILNGADPAVFNDYGNPGWDGASPLRLVTHHWGGNHLKGLDIYEALDRLCGDQRRRPALEFTYIGNLPQGAGLLNSRHLAPMSGEALAREIAAHHVYVTGSQNEPAGMHHIEGALCGLPLLYRESGALPEYCSDFGLGFSDVAGFVATLERMIAEYPARKTGMSAYPHTAARMIDGYLGLFDGMLAEREALLAARRLWRNPWLVARNQASI